uniref:Uncharacterized protein n=1 Tax=Arundo donax TaxID=35708 RepID=A0A0A9C9X2_ARUDO
MAIAKLFHNYKTFFDPKILVFLHDSMTKSQRNTMDNCFDPQQVLKGL